MMALGGVNGECNLCKGTGKIKVVDKPVVMLVEPVRLDNEVIKAVSDCEPTIDIDREIEDKLERLVTPKVDGKRAVFKRKASK